jgi:acid phosphatase
VWSRYTAIENQKWGLEALKRFLAFIALAIGIGVTTEGLAAQQAAVKTRHAARVAALAPGEQIVNLDTVKDRLKQYHDCTRGCYTKDLDLQADRAVAFLRQHLAHRGEQEKPALVLDIDETTLTNYAEMLKGGFAWDPNVFNAWVESGAATAIPGTLRIYQEAQKLGVSVFFLTGRPETQRAATERNLRSRGFENWEELILRAPAQASLTALEYKSSARAVIEARGYRIVLNVGDQWSDLRGKPEAELSVKYPDPYYFLK